MKKIQNSEKAEILLEALPYIQKYTGKIIVIKYGGNAMINDELKNDVMRDLVLLNQVGVKVVLVHGGGPEINETLNRMHIESKFVNGLRKTDGETMEVVQMVLAGKVNKNLVNLIQNLNGKAVGLCGIDGHLFEAEMKDKELGYVGEITKVNVEPIIDLINAGYIPVVSTVACDSNGNVYNVNADIAASKLASELKAASFILMTDVKGILKDPKDDATLIREINVSDIKQLVKEGVISGGMIPKTECCYEAIRRGVGRVFVIDGREPHSILVEVLSDEGVGTMFY